MKKNVIAFLLAAVMAIGSGGPVPVLASETTEHKAVAVEEETVEDNEEISAEKADGEVSKTAEKTFEENTVENAEEEPEQPPTESVEEKETSEDVGIIEDTEEADSADIADTSTESGESVHDEKTVITEDESFADEKSETENSLGESNSVSDTQGPTIESLTVDKNEATVGDILTFTLQLNDESQISTALPSVAFQHNNSQNHDVVLYFEKIDDYTFKSTYEVTDRSVDGIYSVLWVSVDDEYGNHTLTNGVKCTFSISGGVSDSQGPTIESLTVDKDEATVGDILTFTLHLNDESQISTASPTVSFRHNSLKNHDIILYFEKIDDYTYQSTYEVTDRSVYGNYSVYWVSAYDEHGNYTLTSNVICSFLIISKEDYDNTYNVLPLENTVVINTNNTISDTAINGDLYIAPNAVVTLNNVSVEGDIFVLGTLMANTISANTIHVESMTYGGNAYGNGAMSLSGSNSINSLIVGESIIDEIPIRIDGILMSIDGELSIKGAFANIANMYVNNLPVKATSNGRFYLNNIYVGDSNSITVSFIINDREIYRKDYDIIVGTLDNEGNPNGIPIITANNIDVCVGTDINLLEGVEASDYEDGDISSSIETSPATLSTSEPRTFEVVYSVRDSRGTEATRTVSVNIKEHEWNKETIIAEATCSHDGEKRIMCINCGKEKTVVIPAMGHVWNEYYTVDKEATCTEEGFESIHCSVCNAIDEATVCAIPKKEHAYGNWTVTKEATCTKTGSREKSCADCGDKVTEEIPAAGHKWNESYTVDVAPTYTEEGAESIHCSVCGEIKEGSGRAVAKLRKPVSMLTISGIVDRNYNGKEQTQAIVVMDGDTTLVDGTDYTVSYENNTNAGTASVIITGIGNYTDSVTKNFTIKKIANTITAKNFTKTYSTKVQAFALGVKIKNGTPTYKSNSKSVTVSKAGKVTVKAKFIGKATITITVPASTNYTATTKKIAVTVNPTKTALSSVSSPSAGKMTVKWKKNAVGTGYQIQYSTSSKFTSPKAVTIANNSTLTRTIGNLAKGKKYYVRIRTYKTVGSTKFYSGWSAAKAVTIKK